MKEIYVLTCGYGDVEIPLDSDIGKQITTNFFKPSDKDIEIQQFLKIYKHGFYPTTAKRYYKYMIECIKNYGTKNFAELLDRLEYNDFLKTCYWHNIRGEVKRQHKHKCEVCGSRTMLHVHHKTYDNIYFEYDHLEDLNLLCRSHHFEKHKDYKNTLSEFYNQDNNIMVKRITYADVKFIKLITDTDVKQGEKNENI